MSFLFFLVFACIHLSLFEQSATRFKNIFWYLGRYIARMGLLLVLVDWFLEAIDLDLALFGRTGYLLWFFGILIGWFGRATHRDS